MLYTVIVKETKERFQVEATSGDEAQRIVVLRKGITVAKTNAFLNGYVGEVNTPNGVQAVYFRTLEGAKRNTEAFYDCLIPAGAACWDD